MTERVVRVPRAASLRTRGQALARALDAAGALLRAVLGAPDYDRYLAHARRDDPACSALTREEFARERLAARYDRPGSRCC